MSMLVAVLSLSTIIRWIRSATVSGKAVVQSAQDARSADLVGFFERERRVHRQPAVADLLPGLDHDRRLDGAGRGEARIGVDGDRLAGPQVDGRDAHLRL